MATSASRVMRKTAVARISQPGNSAATFAAITSSSRASYEPVLGRHARRTAAAGWAPARRRSSSVGRSGLPGRQHGATCNCKPGSRGDGSSSSTASGVSTGRISLAEVGPRSDRCCRSVQSRGLADAQAVLGELRQDLADAGGLLVDHAVGAPADGRQLLRRASCPAGSRRRTPAARCCISPATRTWKNSSRFELTMARNFSRSSSGSSSREPLPQHAVVELQPAQLAVDVQLRRGDGLCLGQCRCVHARSDFLQADFACRRCPRTGRPSRRWPAAPGQVAAAGHVDHQFVALPLEAEVGRCLRCPRARASATRRMAASLLTTTRVSRGSDMYSRCVGLGMLRRW